MLTLSAINNQLLLLLYHLVNSKKPALYLPFLVMVGMAINPVYAQKNIVAKHPKIVARVDSLNDVANPLISIDAGKAFTLLTQAELLAKEYGYTQGLAVAYLNQAEVLSQRGYTTRALELYYSSMQLSQRNNDIYNVARAEQHISSIKRKGGGYKEAEIILNRTLKIFKKLNKLVDIVNIQLRLGLLKTDQKQYADARRFYQEAYELSKSARYTYGEKKSYYNQALLYKTLGKRDSAILFLNKALHLDTLRSDTYGKALSYIELSRLYVNSKNYGKAWFYAKAAYIKADSTQALALVKSAVQLLIYVSKESVDKDAIIQWQDELIVVDNTISERERKEANDFIDALRMQEEQQLKNQARMHEVETQSRKQESLILLYSGVMLVFVIVVFTLSYNYQRAKRYNEVLNAKKKQIEQQNQKLEDDNELKSKLLSIITHDLRKPLANTQSIIHLVNMDMVTPEESQDLFGQLEAQYTRVITLTDNLLFWIKGQVSGAPIEVAPVNLQSTISSIIEEQKIPVSEKDIRVDNHLPTDFIWLAEVETLRIVFRNLLNNAVKFTPKGGVIEIYGDNTKVETCITVKDSGIGISAEVMERINSENYYSTKGTQNEEGTGFGLMLIRDLVKKQNGKLKISSVPGEGSAFTVSFPASIAIKS